MSCNAVACWDRIASFWPALGIHSGGKWGNFNHHPFASGVWLHFEDLRPALCPEHNLAAGVDLLGAFGCQPEIHEHETVLDRYLRLCPAHPKCPGHKRVQAICGDRETVLSYGWGRPSRHLVHMKLWVVRECTWLARDLQVFARSNIANSEHGDAQVLQIRSQTPGASGILGKHSRNDV